MMKTVRLYRQHDMDLISLYLTPGFKFTKNMKEAVKAVLNGTPFTVNTPQYAPKKGYLGRLLLIHVCFSDNDPDLAALQKIKAGQCNSFFKAAMRACLDYFPYEAYFGGDGIALSVKEARAGMGMQFNGLSQTQLPGIDEKAEPQPEPKVEPKPELQSKSETKKTKPVKKVEPKPVPNAAEDTSDTEVDNDFDLFSSIMSATKV